MSSEDTALDPYHSIYNTTNIDPSRRGVRLVHILPGSWQDQMRCELHVGDLDSKPVYETLSYVWGDSSITTPILLNGEEFRITLNLAAALRRLRQRDEKRIIWIDALCINQMDDEEKNIQVKMMGAIYENCYNCNIWLGEPPGHELLESLEKPLPWLMDTRVQDLESLLDDPRAKNPIFAVFLITYIISKDLHIHENPCLAAATHKGDLALDPRLRAGEHGLRLFLNNKWWFRIWTVQESILPPKSHIIFGVLSAPWKMFDNAVHIWDKHINDLCCDHTTTNSNFTFTMFDYSRIFFKISYYRWMREKGVFDPLDKYLLDFSSRKATNELDQVFGFVGLIKPESVDSKIVPDYKMTTYELYSHVSFHLITTSETRMSLEICTVNESELPSWVVDWRNPFSRTQEGIAASRRIKRITYNQIYELQRAPMFAELIDKYMLHIHGVKVAVITACSKEIDMTYRIQNNIPSFEEINHLMRDEWTLPRRYPSGGTLEKAYWNTLIGDLIETGRGLASSRTRKGGDEDGNIYRNWWSKYMKFIDMADNEEEKKAVEFHRAAKIASHGRKFYVTDNGYLGTGPTEMQEGDEVYVLAGFRIPFVLRRCAEKSGETKTLGPRFTLIGGCYMHGIMFGELGLQEKDYKDVILV